MLTVSLTLGEVLWLYRRRSTMTQTAFAAMSGVTEQQLRAMEQGEAKVMLHLAQLSQPHAHTPPVMPWEWCALARRRAGSTVAMIGHAIHRSHTWVIAMENARANCKPLVQWWMPRWKKRSGTPLKLHEGMSAYTKRTVL